MAGWGPRGPGASEHCGCIGPGCGFQSRGGGFAASRLTFHQLGGSPGCSDRVRALGGEFGERQVMAGLAGAPWGPCEMRRAPEWARRASSDRSQYAAAAASTCGERPESHGAGVREKEPASSACVWELPTGRHPRCAEFAPSTASFPPGYRRRASGRRTGPRGAQAQLVPCATWTHSSFSYPDPPLSLRKSGCSAVLWVAPGDIPPTLGGGLNTQS